MEGQTAPKGRPKTKTKKSTSKTKTPKKNSKSCEGPTCSMFLADLTRKLQLKRKHEENVEMTTNIIHTIIDTISSATVTVSKKVPDKPEPKPVNIDQLQTLAPELMPRDTLEMPGLSKDTKSKQHDYEVNEVSDIITLGDTKSGTKWIPKMPVVTSEVMKPKPRIIGSMHDMAVNTGGDHDVATELERHVKTLKKISLIAEEFNQKTAKNLKEIVDSVQADLIKKLEEVQQEKLRKKIEEDLEEIEEEILPEIAVAE